MALTRLPPTSRAALVPTITTLRFLSSALTDLRISMPTVTTISRRHASHQNQGRANGAKQGPGKRLGAKKAGGEYVVPGNILFKQRGTHWFPGDNCFMGRDHTIHAGSPGYVRYYRDPHRHPKRKFIGIVFEPDQSLPQPLHAVRRRQLGMLAYEMPQPVPEQDSEDSIATTLPDGTTLYEPNAARPTTSAIPPSSTMTTASGLKLTLRPGYQYRAANWEIGRSAELAEERALSRNKKDARGIVIGATKVPQFMRGDRFAAWRKSGARIARNAERRALTRKGGKRKK